MNVSEANADRLLVVDLQTRRGPELYAFARRMGMADDEAGDAVQETLLRAWVAIDAGPMIRDLDAWAFRTLYRICMDEHRWRRRGRQLVERLRFTAPRPSESSAADRLTIWEAVDRLPDAQRRVMHLRYRSDLSFEQIGAILGIKSVTARSQASRALDRLASSLSREDFR